MAFMRAPDVHVPSAYDNSFGELEDETVVWDPFNDVDMGQDITKAVNVGAGSGTPGFAMTPLAYDRQVTDITRRFTPVLGMIPKVTNQGISANYYRLTARAAAEWGTEQGAMTEEDDTDEKVSESIKYCRVAGKVTGVAQAGSKHFIDSMRKEVLNKTQSMNEELEDTLLNGDASTYPLEPDGLIKLCTSNNTDMGGADIALSDVKTAVNDSYVDKGQPNLIITDTYTATALEDQMMDYVHYVNPYQSFAWGLESLAISTVVGRLPVLVSQFMPSTSGSRRMLIVNTNMLEQRVLQDITYEKLAKTEDAEKFYLKTYRTLINRFPEGMAQIYGIK